MGRLIGDLEAEFSDLLDSLIFDMVARGLETEIIAAELYNRVVNSLCAQGGDEQFIDTVIAQFAGVLRSSVDAHKEAANK